MVDTSKGFKYNQIRADGQDKKSSNLNNNNPLEKKRANMTINAKTTTAYVQILGTGMDTHDTIPSVLLFFDKQRFIFNAGEGLQRFCSEHKIKLSKIDHICLTPCAQRLPVDFQVCINSFLSCNTKIQATHIYVNFNITGLLLTLAGIGDGISVNIWGPSDLKLLVEAMKCFIPHGAMVDTHLISDNPFVLVENEVVKISAVLLRPSNSEGYVKPSDISVVYVCELHEIMGKFNKQKADELGITVRTKYRELQQNKSVKSNLLDIMVHPSDVLAPSIPGPVVLIVDCPTESHAEELLSIESLNSYYSDCSGNKPNESKTVNCVIHLSPASVVKSPNYDQWMQKFGSAQHIFAGHAMKNVKIPILKSSARVTTRLNYLCPQFFPAPMFWSFQNNPNASLDSIASSEDSISKNYKSISAENLLKFTLRPPANLGLDQSSVPSPTSPSDVIDDLLTEIPEIVDAAQHVSQFWQETKETQDDRLITDDTFPSCLENIRRDDLEIVFLGTGSALPSKYRNVSSIYINLYSKGGLLFDCGEGTMAQLKRRYGEEAAENVVRNLRCVWISHIHADHHAGVVRILALRQQMLNGVSHEPILVIGPSQLKRFLDAYQRLEDLNMQFLDCRNTTAASWDAFEVDAESKEDQLFPGSRKDTESTTNLESTSLGGEAFMQGTSKRKKLSLTVDNGACFQLLKSLKVVLREAGMERLISFRVVHCPESFGVVLKAAERINSAGKVIPGWKVVYSGDTRPCSELIEASHGATILIHEATFEDGMVGEAIAKNHSTTKEAIEVGDSAAAYRIILTHFSQRYPKVPSLDEISMQKTCIAFDLMSINIADLPVLPNVLPYLKLLFKNETVIDN